MLQDNRLHHIDQALYLGLRATGQAAVCQCLWIYEHDVDVEGLTRFHQQFGHGLAGRRIERSPLPFGRHRWVACPGPQADIRFEEGVRPRDELMEWADEHACLPVDPEWGPVWHMGVQRFDDGSTAVSLVGSHCVGDGGGACLTVFEAVTGNTRDLGYPAPRSRTRRQALRADARDTLRDLPEVGRTLVNAAKLAVKRRGELTKSGGPKGGRHPGPGRRSATSGCPRWRSTSTVPPGTPAPPSSAATATRWWRALLRGWGSGWAGAAPSTARCP